MEEYQAVLRTAELGPGQIREVEAHGEPVALLNVGQTYYALSALCPTDDTNLAREGRLNGYLLVCPSDHATFDIRCGARVEPPGPGIRHYAIHVAGNRVEVGPALEDGAAQARDGGGGSTVAARNNETSSSG